MLRKDNTLLNNTHGIKGIFITAPSVGQIKLLVARTRRAGHTLHERYDTLYNIASTSSLFDRFQC